MRKIKYDTKSGGREGKIQNELNKPLRNNKKMV
jgi:hypothetical protein